MARTTHRKAARKQNYCQKGGHTIEVGQPYHYAEFRYRGKAVGCPEHPLRPSDHTGSKMSIIMAAQEALQDIDAQDHEARLSEVDNVVTAIREVSEDYAYSVQNMPEGLQQGYKGEMMQELADNLEYFASDIEGQVEEVPEIDVTLEDEDEVQENLEERENAIDELIEKLENEVPEPEW